MNKGDNMGCIKNAEKIQYTIKHRKAFRKIEKQLLGKNTIRSVFHDLDKIIMMFFVDKKKASEIHRKNSRHHDKARTEKDYIQMIIDWECARYTKADKPLNARETLYKYYPSLVSKIEPLLKRLGL